MARSRKHVDVKEIRLDGYDSNENIAKAMLRLNRDTMEYEAEYAGRTYTGKVADEVIAEVERGMKEANDVAWHEAIEVMWVASEPGRFDTDVAHQGMATYIPREDGDKGSGAFKFTFERFLWAKFPDGKLRKVGWHARNRDLATKLSNAHGWSPRYVGMEAGVVFSPPVRGAGWMNNPGPHMFLPYTDEVWVGLSLLAQNVQSLNAKLAQLLSTEQGHAMLASSALPFTLPAPKSEAE